MFVTAISLKYALLASRWSYGHFLKLIEFYLNNTINFRHLTQRIIQCYTHKMALVSWPQTPWRHFTLCIKLPARCGWRNNYRFLCFRVVYVCIYIIRGEYRLIADYVHLQDMQCTVTEAAGVTPTGIVGQSACLYLHWMITDWQSRRLYASYYVVPRQLTTWRLRAMSGHKLNTLLGSGLRQQLTVTAVDDKVAPRQPLTTESYRSVTLVSSSVTFCPSHVSRNSKLP